MAVPLIFLLFILSINGKVDDETVIRNKLFDQAKCWNNRDIDCFMRDYWKSDSLKYIGKKGITYGWERTLNNYKSRYPTKKEMGQLKFEIIHLSKISDSHYFMAGKWRLNREAGDIMGHFSLLWEKINNEWVIIADHSG